MSDRSKIDLHVHTRFSSNAGNSFLKLIGAQECYSTPKQVYQRAKHRGMDYVTISDHDTIDGALQLAHLDDFFISEEVTAFFPEDRAKMHVVCLNVNETHHSMLQSLRYNVYDLVKYLNQKNITHFIAHPFYGMSKLEVHHIEKMMLLFKTFEVRNGGKELYPDNLLEKILSELTPSTIFNLADKHQIEPVGKSPWMKNFVGGSDDHGGISIAYPHTSTPRAESVTDLLSYIENGLSQAEGDGGSPFSVANGIMGVAIKNFSVRKDRKKTFRKKLALHFAGHFFTQPKPYWQKQEAALLFASASGLHKIQQKFNPGKSNPFVNELLTDSKWRDYFVNGIDFNTKNSEWIYNRLKDTSHNHLKNLLNQNKNIDKKSIKSWSKSLLPMLPYLIGFHTEYRDKPLMRKIRKTYCSNYSSKVAVFSDVSSSESRDSVLLQIFQKAESIKANDIKYFGLSDEANITESSIEFVPLANAYFFENSDVGFKLPPLFDVLSTFVKGDYHLIYLHTFGLMGVLGLLISKLLQIPVICQYPYTEIRSLQINSANTKQASIATHVIRNLLKWADKIRIDSDLQYRHAIKLGVVPERAGIERNLANFSNSWIKPFSILGQTEWSPFDFFEKSK